MGGRVDRYVILLFDFVHTIFSRERNVGISDGDAVGSVVGAPDGPRDLLAWWLLSFPNQNWKHLFITILSTGRLCFRAF